MPRLLHAGHTVQAFHQAAGTPGLLEHVPYFRHSHSVSNWGRVRARRVLAQTGSSNTGKAAAMIPSTRVRVFNSPVGVNNCKASVIMAQASSTATPTSTAAAAVTAPLGVIRPILLPAYPAVLHRPAEGAYLDLDKLRMKLTFLDPHKSKPYEEGVNTLIRAGFRKPTTFFGPHQIRRDEVQFVPIQGASRECPRLILDAGAPAAQ
jgi:hypothetical protein